MRCINIVVNTKESTGQSNIPNITSLPDKHYALGVATRRRRSSRRAKNKNMLVSDTVFDNSFLSLKVGTTSDYVEELPLSLLEQFTNYGQHHFYPLNGMNLQLANSSIHCKQEKLLKSDEAYELIFFYCLEEEVSYYKSKGMIK